MDVNWTDEKVELLKKLVRSGMSYKDIGGELGCSRNAAIGKARRLGIDTEHVRAHKLPTRRTIRSREFKAARVVAERGPGRVISRSGHHGSIVKMQAPPRPMVWEEEAVSWDDLKLTGMCKWPVRSDPIMFCGSECKGPYCKFHFMKSRRAYERREEK